MSKVAAVLFVKNEVEDIAFWLAWHFYCGFDTIIVYDDFSTDGTWEMLNQAGEVFDVRCRRAIAADQFNIRQQKTYLDALNTYRDEFEWLLVLDSDEYLDIRDGSDVHTFLSHYPEAHGIALNWCCYGSSNHVIKPPSPNVFENYIQRSDRDFEYNYTVKSFIRPKYTDRIYINPHRFAVDGPYVTADYNPVTWKDEHPERTKTLAQWDVARVNHYFIRSVYHYLEKMKRRVDIRDSLLGLNLFRYCDRNDHYDTILSDRYDGMMPWLYRMQNQVNLMLLKLMIATCGRGLNGEIENWTSHHSAGLSAFTLRTVHGSTLCYVKETGRLCHLRLLDNGALAEPVIALTSPHWKDGIFLTTASGDTPLFAVGDPRVSTVLSFKTEQQNDRQFALRSPVTGLIASFLGDAGIERNVEINRSRINTWELLVSLSFEPKSEWAPNDGLAVLKHLPDPSSVHVGKLSNEAADAFIAGVQLLPASVRAYWKARNKVPSYPWLENDSPLSV